MRHKYGLIMSLVVLLLAGCGGGTTSLEATRVTACDAIEDKIEHTDATVLERTEQIKCVRLVCDELHERITGEP